MSSVYIFSKMETYVKKFRLYGSNVTFKFNSPPDGVGEIAWVRQGLQDILETMTKDCTDRDYLGFELRSLNFKNKEPGYVAFRPASEINSDILWKIFGGIIQSNADSCTSSDILKVKCTKISVPMGRGKVRPGLYNNFKEECSGRRGIVVIKNSDSLCLPRALVVAKACCEKNPRYKLIRDSRKKVQTEEAQKLMTEARIEIPEEGAGLHELEKFQNFLPEHKITVYNYGCRGREIYFEGEVQNPKYNLNLIFKDGHFNVITSVTAAFACSYFCETCHTPYNTRVAHRCSSTCYACKRSPACVLENDGIHCVDCNRQFKNQNCFATHLKGICRSIRKCPDCEKIVIFDRRSSEHVCGEVYCKMCTEYLAPDHKCYMRIDTRKPPLENFLYIFFDLETRQDEVLDSAQVHRVNLCVSQQYCWLCVKGGACDVCKDRTRVFREDPVNKFMVYVMQVRKAYKKVCVVAHNGQGFDFQFLLKYVLEETQFTPELITRGTKILLMEIDNVKFIDSLNYMPMPLSKLPKAFDLPPEKKKGYFPHLFNTVQNQNYVGPIPAKEFYCPDSMFDKGHKEFEKWHDEQVRDGYVFDFEKEIFEYCYSDVDILAQACLKFRASFLQECNVDPFLEAVTIASACNLVFRRNFLKPKTISLLPKLGYRFADNQSPIALKWLIWESDQRGVHIHHAGNSREIKIDGSKVDGFDGSRIYEFQGCYWHGCSECYPNGRDDPLEDDPSDTLNARLERTRAKMVKLSRQYETIEMRECQFRKLLKTNHEMVYLDSHPLLNNVPLNPRDAFFGGRTGNTKSYVKAKENEMLQYVDVCSLYPWVCKYGKYPVGHPQIYVGDRDCRVQRMDVDGLLKCTVLPPRQLYHPVLPTKMNDKLMFILCRTCGENLISGDCVHRVEERTLTGTWTMDEIRKAVEKGYIILEMFELCQYEMVSGSDGLFLDFINQFLKIKQEASNFPSWCDTESLKQKYVEEYYENEGIRLDIKKIKKNEGLRSLAKLMLNSFWGKFGQRENQTKTSIVRQPTELFKILISPSVDVNNIQEVNQEVVVVSWQYTEDACETLPTVNVVLAAYTTAQARLKLYEHLDVLGDKVCYYDTDSIIYLHKAGEYKIPTGDYLGQMTDELTDYGPGSYISEFVSGGPKTYGYKVSTADDQIHTVCKVKGLTLNLRTAGAINFETLKRLVADPSQTILTEESRIRRTKDRNVITVKEAKIFKVTGAKRKREDEHDTLPYGYKKKKYE